MTALYKLLAREPVLLAVVVEAVATFAVLDTDWTEVRKAGLLAIVSAFNAWWVRVLSTPEVKVAERVTVAAHNANLMGYQQATDDIRALDVPKPKKKA